MSRTIHGLSHKSLKVLRRSPAALAVYWVYVSRTNNEGVAWPSAARLAIDLGWVKDTCLEGRKLLVEHEALERVKEYVRPEWRKLDEAERKRKISLDRSEYYRPTGYIIVNGVRLPLLYNGSDEPSEIDGSLAEHDSLQGRPSLASSVGGIVGRQDSPELDSIPKLDSIGRLDSNSTSAPDGAVKVVKPTKQSLRNNSIEKHDAVIRALLNRFKSDFDLTVLRPKDLYTKTQDQYIEVAEILCKHGLTAEDVPGLLRYLDAKGWSHYGVGKAAEYAPDYAAVKARELIKPAPVETDAAIFTDEQPVVDNSELLNKLRERLAAEKPPQQPVGVGMVSPEFWKKGEPA
jgi:hypothetical protein